MRSLHVTLWELALQRKTHYEPWKERILILQEELNKMWVSLQAEISSRENCSGHSDFHIRRKGEKSCHSFSGSQEERGRRNSKQHMGQLACMEKQQQLQGPAHQLITPIDHAATR